ncbi:MAG: dephospho-CoA kinase [Eubacteriales bacterium]|nr:dephospho-CoA kinase [Eubacteriales bacterium]
MKVLGITGGVGAGKSTVLAYLERVYQARVIELDKVAHELMEPGQEGYQKIIEKFGEDILAPDGSIDRGMLYQKAFSDRQRVEELNSIVHPLVKKEVCRKIEQERKKRTAAFVVLEAALLLEDHYDAICDEIWYIYVENDVRRERLKKSRGYSEEKIRSILENQKSDREFRIFCQFVVDNSSNIIENTYGQIDKGLKEHEFV